MVVILVKTRIHFDVKNGSRIESGMTVD